MPTERLTHNHLILKAINWLKTAKKCPTVLAELSSARREIPDAIGWRARGLSVLVECKVSRSDFLKDNQKSFRMPGAGMGRERWYMVTPGVIKDLEEVPTGWGVIEVQDGRCRVLKASKPFDLLPKAALQETFLLSCAVARVQGRGSVAPIQDPAQFIEQRMTVGKEVREAQALPTLSPGQLDMDDFRRDVLQRKVRGQIRALGRAAYRMQNQDLQQLACHLTAISKIPGARRAPSTRRAATRLAN